MVASDLHDDLLINRVLIQLGGHRGAKGMVGVVAGKTSLLAHQTHGCAQSVDPSRVVDIPGLPKELFPWL